MSITRITGLIMGVYGLMRSLLPRAINSPCGICLRCQWAHSSALSRSVELNSAHPAENEVGFLLISLRDLYLPIRMLQWIYGKKESLHNVTRHEIVFLQDVNNKRLMWYPKREAHSIGLPPPRQFDPHQNSNDSV